MKLKKKLISATLSLVVATVLMASSSYAWFTISTNPEVSNIKTSITANENIEIALDNGYANAEAVDAAGAVINGLGQSGNPYTWGNLLDLSTAMTNIGGMLSLKPVGYSYDSATDKVTMKTPEYGLDGRVARLNNMAQQYISAYNAITSPSGGVSVFKPSEDAATADALALSFWLRSNEDVSLKLSEGTFRADDGTNADGTVNAENGGGSTLTMNVGNSLQALNDLIPEIRSHLETMEPVLSSYVMELHNPLPGIETYAVYEDVWETWNSHYQAINALLAGSQAVKESGMTVACYLSASNGDAAPVRYNLSDLTAELSHDWTGEALPLTSILFDISYNYTDWNLVCEIAPSDNLLNFLKKVKIRLRVLQGAEVKDYYAQISPRISMTEVACPTNRAIPSDYVFMFRDISYFPSESICMDDSLEDYEIDEDTGKVTFFLHLYSVDDPGFEEYRTALFWSRYFSMIIGQQYNLMRDYVQILYGYSDEVAKETADAYSAFLNNTSRRILTEAEMALPHINLTANEAKKVDVYMYLDGEQITNADALTMDGVELSLNLQFEKIGGATNAMTAAESCIYGRQGDDNGSGGYSGPGVIGGTGEIGGSGGIGEPAGIGGRGGASDNGGNGGI